MKAQTTIASEVKACTDADEYFDIVRRSIANLRDAGVPADILKYVEIVLQDDGYPYDSNIGDAYWQRAKDAPKYAEYQTWMSEQSREDAGL